MGFMDAVGGAINAATDAVSDIAGGIGDVVEDVGSSLGEGMGGLGDTFESMAPDLGPIGDVLGGAMDMLSGGGGGGGGIGDMLGGGLDKLGISDWIGDIGGGVLDFCSGSKAGQGGGLGGLADIANVAGGGGDIGGFLDIGSKIGGMFSGGLGSIGGGGGQGGSGISDLLGGMSQSAGSIGQAAGGIGDLLGGDIAGAGQGFLDMFGSDMGAIGGGLGQLGNEGSEMLGQLIPQGKSVLSTIDGAMGQGQLDAGNLQDLLGAGGGGQNALGSSMADFAQQSNSILDQVGQTAGLTGGGDLASTLFDGVVGAASDQLGADHPDIPKLQARADFASQLVEMAAQDPAAADVLEELLGQTGGLSDSLEPISQQNISLRA